MIIQSLPKWAKVILTILLVVVGIPKVLLVADALGMWAAISTTAFHIVVIDYIWIERKENG